MDDESFGARRRPYTLVGGRTARSDFRVEALVSAPSYDPDLSARLLPHVRSIYELAARGRVSVAELSPTTSLPLGVVRVLIADLVAEGHLTVHQVAERPSRELLERVLRGLRNLPATAPTAG